MSASTKPKSSRSQTGKLRIGDDWNAINIIALSQSNPLKAVAEFVENSIDAHARHVTIIRGRSRGQSYLKVVDDGDGVPLDADGRPNFKYVATHIGDSIKRQMKAQGQQGIQGEFGIGLLSFWTVGESLALVSPGSDGKAYEMRMAKGSPSYSISHVRRLLPDGGTELTIQPLLPGIRHFSGDKLQWYLASELRDRIRQSGVEISIVDRQARKEYRVEPRAFAGQLLHHLVKDSLLQRGFPGMDCRKKKFHLRPVASADPPSGIALSQTGVTRRFFVGSRAVNIARRFWRASCKNAWRSAFIDF